jgi:DNA-binding HxlR family transcriptional regulator
MAHALDLVGERWALLIARELLFGAKRFSDLRASLAGASSAIVVTRLRELEESGIVRRRRLGPPAPAWVYELTPWGARLEPVLVALSRWASESPQLQRHGPLGADSLMLALSTLFDPVAADNWRAVFAVALGEDRFRVEIADGKLSIARGAADPADAVIETDAATLDALLWGDLTLAAATREKAATVSGAAAAVRRFLTLFPMPSPTSAV